MRTPFRAAAGLTILAAAGVLAALLALPALAKAPAPAKRAKAVKPTVVVVTATEFKFTLSKATAPVGTVVFRVTNRGKISHDFRIAGKKTPTLAPGKTASLTVVFKKPARYAYVCTLPGHAAAGMKGLFPVGVARPLPTQPAPKPAPKPAPVPPATTAATTTTAAPAPAAGAQTVNVGMTEFSFQMSTTTLHVGTVTFNVVNNGSISHNFALLALGDTTPNLDPGQSTTLTVTFTKPGTYQFECTLPQHAEAGMEGTLTVQ